MPALLEIVEEAEIRALARGKLAAEKQKAVSETIRSDTAAFAIFKDEILKKGKENTMIKQEQLKVEKRDAKQGDNSWLSAKLLVGSFVFIASLGVITFAAMNFGA